VLKLSPNVSRRTSRDTRADMFSYCDQLVHESNSFDAELVERVICNMKRGKAAGLHLGLMSGYLTW